MENFKEKEHLMKCQKLKSKVNKSILFELYKNTYNLDNKNIKL